MVLRSFDIYATAGADTATDQVIDGILVMDDVTAAKKTMTDGSQRGSSVSEIQKFLVQLSTLGVQRLCRLDAPVVSGKNRGQ